MLQKIFGVGCGSHIVHNTMQTSADLLPIDIEQIIIKIYGHFHIYTVRVNTLAEFCNATDVEYQKLLGYSKTRWLALLPAIERVLRLFNPLKDYFQSIKKCPTVIKTFFENDLSEIWLLFLHNQASLFEETIRKIEGDNVSAVEVFNEISSLKYKCDERLKCSFVPIVIKAKIKKHVEDGKVEMQWFLKEINAFYLNCIEYFYQTEFGFLLIWKNLIGYHCVVKLIIMK